MPPYPAGAGDGRWDGSREAKAVSEREAMPEGEAIPESKSIPESKAVTESKAVVDRNAVVEGKPRRKGVAANAAAEAAGHRTMKATAAVHAPLGRSRVGDECRHAKRPSSD